jgi:hypothetical protein
VVLTLSPRDSRVVEAAMRSPRASALASAVWLRALMLVVAVLLVCLVAPPLAFGHGEGDSDQSLVCGPAASAAGASLCPYRCLRARDGVQGHWRHPIA